MIDRWLGIVLAFGALASTGEAQVRGESPRAQDAPGTRGVATRGESGRTARGAPEPRFPPPGTPAIECPTGDGGSASGAGATTWRGAWTDALTRAVGERGAVRSTSSGAGDALSGRGRRGVSVDRAFVAEEVVPGLQRVVRDGAPSRVMAPVVRALGLAAARDDLAPFAVHDLRRALAHDALIVRMQAAAALGRLGDVDVLEALLHDTQSGRLRVGRDEVSADLRAAAALALATAGYGAASVVELLADEELPIDARAACAVALGMFRDDAGVAPLRRLAVDESTHLVLRVAAFTALGRRGARVIVPDALAVLDDASTPAALRVAAARVIGDAAVPVPSVLDALTDTAERSASPAVRSACWLALGDLARHAATLRDGDVEVWAAALEASYLGRAPASDRPWIAWTYARVLAARPGAVAGRWSALRARSGGGEAGLALSVAQTLHGSDERIDELLDVLRDGSISSQLRGWCAMALGETDSGRARDALFALLRSDDVDAALRVTLARVAARIDPVRAQVALSATQRRLREPAFDDVLAELGDVDAALRALVVVDDPAAPVADRAAAARRLAAFVGGASAPGPEPLPADLRVSAVDVLAGAR